MSEKISQSHLQRRAILYVRQSSAQQLAHNEESRRLQYAMRERLHALGWRDVEVIDEDLGKSAAGSTERSGFRKLVADVSLGLVGVVAAREVSRFARNSRDWQQLVEICRVVDTVLVDHDTVYAPRVGNDRLLLGLKGSLNEYELDLLRMRGEEAKREKAARGELMAGVPVGYRASDDGKLEKTPDQRVRQMVELVFAKFFELGSARQVMLWLRAATLQVAVNRDRHGNVDWKDATRDHVYEILTNPTYAGAYAYGRTQRRSRVVNGHLGTAATRVPRNEWEVLLHNHHEGYITWEDFERVTKMLRANANRAGHGAARQGQALLAGLVWCRRCGRRAGVSYSSKAARFVRYACHAAHDRYGDTRCMSFSALDVDAQVARQLLVVLQPGALEAAHSAAAEQAGTKDRAVEALQLQADQARYQAARAERQYNAVDPDNRTVARELERRWNAALDAVREIDQRIKEAQATRHDPPPAAPNAQLLVSLARHMERVWHAGTTDVVLKKRIVRTLIEQVWAEVDDTRRVILLVIHWKGGAHTEMTVAKRRTGVRRNTTSPDVVEAVRVLARIMPDQPIAVWLGMAGLRTPSGGHYTRALVASVRHLREIPAFSEERQRAEGWLNSEQAAELLQVHPKTIRRAVARNELPVVRPIPGGPCVFSRADLVGPAGQRVTTRARQWHPEKSGEHSPEQLIIDIPHT